MCVVPAIAFTCVCFALAMFDWSLVHRPDDITRYQIRHDLAKNMTRDALTTAVFGAPIDASAFEQQKLQSRPLDVAILHEIISCDRFSVETLLEYVHNDSSPLVDDACHRMMGDVFYHDMKASIGDTVHLLQEFYTHVKAPGGACQVHGPFSCEYYDSRYPSEMKQTTDEEPPKIAILIIAADVMDSARDLSIQNKREYASRHGYDVHVLTEADVQIQGFPRAKPWLKIPFIASLLSEYEYVWSLDLDTLIVDMSVDIERLTDDRFDLIVGVDQNGINTGSFLLKNSAWSWLFLYTWWLEDNVEPLGWWEQSAIHKMSKNELIGNHIKRVKQQEFNSYEGNIMMHPDELPFVLHFAGDANKWSKLVMYSNVLKNVTH